MQRRRVELELGFAKVRVLVTSFMERIASSSHLTERTVQLKLSNVLTMNQALVRCRDRRIVQKCSQWVRSVRLGLFWYDRYAMHARARSASSNNRAALYEYDLRYAHHRCKNEYRS